MNRKPDLIVQGAVLAKFILGSHLRHRAVESRAAAHVLWFVDLAFIAKLASTSSS